MVFLFVLVSLSSVLFPHYTSLQSSLLLPLLFFSPSCPPFLCYIASSSLLYTLSPPPSSPPPPSSSPPLPSLVPILSFSTEEYRVGEGTNNATVVITRQGDTTVPITVMLNSEPTNATGEWVPFPYHISITGNETPNVHTIYSMNGLI